MEYSHEIVQQVDDVSAARIHAYLHCKGGSDWNARTLLASESRVGVPGQYEPERGVELTVAGYRVMTTEISVWQRLV